MFREMQIGLNVSVVSKSYYSRLTEEQCFPKAPWLFQQEDMGAAFGVRLARLTYGLPMDQPKFTSSRYAESQSFRKLILYSSKGTNADELKSCRETLSVEKWLRVNSNL